MTEVLKESSKKVSYSPEFTQKRAKKMVNKKIIHETINEDKTIVQQMEEEWPQMTSEFRRLQREQYELFLHKQHDYGPGNISVGSQLQTEEEVHLSLTGLWFRMNDKIQRLKTLLMSGRKNAVEGEPIEDAFLDVSNYGIMATIVKNGKWGK
jgi:hypothetical protein